MDRISFAPNIPLTLSLMYSEGRNLENGGVMYTLSDQRVMFLEKPVAESLDKLAIQPGESFGICKRWNGLRGRASDLRWDIWLTPDTEKARAKAEAPELERQLKASLDAIRDRQTSQNGKVLPMPAPALPLAPTGTDGPALPAVAQAPGRKPPQSGRIPMDVAFAEAVKLVKTGGRHLFCSLGSDGCGVCCGNLD
jgi:hypothetical protein